MRADLARRGRAAAPRAAPPARAPPRAPRVRRPRLRGAATGIGPFVYDDARGKLLALSRLAADGAPQVTYAWDGGALTELAPATASPSPSRRDFGLASDRGRGKVVLFGGERRPSFNLAETWEWPQLTYDTARGRVLMFGGRNNAGLLNDLWSWDGTTWTELSVASTTKPPGQSPAGSLFAFDEARKVAVLAVGGNGGGATWEWDGASWRNDGASAGGSGASLVYDATRGAVVAHASSNACFNGGEPSSTLLLWDGRSYARVVPGFQADAAGCTGVPFAAFDRARGRMVLSGMWRVNTPWPIGELYTEDVPNRAPRIADVVVEPAGLVYANTPLTIRVNAEDPDGHALRLVAESLPSGAVLDEAAGVVRWTPRADQLGEAKLAIGVTDGIRTATREVAVDVRRFDSTLFPAGRIELRADVTWKGSTEDCGGVGSSRCRRSASDTGYARCSVQGDNPGRVAIRCEGVTRYSWLYDRFRGVWGSNDAALASSGDVASDGRWSTSGGTTAGSLAMSGSVRKDALGDLELCVGLVKYTPNGTLRAEYAGEGCAPLYPVP